MTEPTSPPPIADPHATLSQPLSAGNGLKITRTAAPSRAFQFIYRAFTWLCVLVVTAALAVYILERFGIGISDFKIEFNL
ncbi:hypothetical protein EON80_31860 [bacterium]|nr:MAG: hypothetical protein EON80_31860 [bacterium]